MEKKASEESKSAAYKTAVEALQQALDTVGKILGKRAGIMVSLDQIDNLKGDRDLYDVLDDLLKEVMKHRP
jgi:hypothetical protein